MRKFAITDIHGCLLTFEALLQKIDLQPSDELYLLGDYIDRGPDSKGVLDCIFSLKERGFTVHCLRGNHDQAMLDALRQGGYYESWVNTWGGRQTLDSFQTDDLRKIPGKYWEFLDSLGYCFEVNEYILVHAGLDFSKTNPLKIGEEMFWLRDWYDDIDYDWLGSRIIVHGHTPVPVEMMGLYVSNIEKWRVVDIDTGCFASHLPGKGYLTALDLTKREVFLQKNLDDVSGFWKSR